MRIVRTSSKQFEILCNRQIFQKKRVMDTVARIIQDVKQNGDKALIKYTSRFDGIRLHSKDIRVSDSEKSGAYQDVNPEFVNTLRVVMANINRFYKRQLRKSWKIKDEDGVLLGEKYTPIEKVGVYVPGGTAPLVSSVYMSVLPAKIAGVKEIYLMTPPNKYKCVEPHILAVADLLKVDGIFKIGGAQAIAALAFGTKTVPRVDKIVGPGNSYVTEAKRQVFGFVDIDMLAGPSEVVIIANRSSDSKYVIADLRAQGEHLQGLPILVTNSKRLARIVKKEVRDGYIILVKNIGEAIEVTNKLAPEHLEIMLNNSQAVLKKIVNAGAIFLGPYSPTVVGDYVAGPSHVLPTNATSRFFSGLGINDFIKSSHIIHYSKKALEKVVDPIEKLCNIEGLHKHLNSLKVRFE